MKNSQVNRLLVVVSFVGLGGLLCNPLLAQLAEANGVQGALSKFGKTLEVGRSETEQFLRTGRAEGACGDVYRPFSSSLALVPRDAVQQFADLEGLANHLLAKIRPITDVEQEVLKRRQELRKVFTDVQARIDELAGLKMEIDELRMQRDREAAVLRQLREGQRGAVRNWLLQSYGNIAGTAVSASSEEGLFIATTLFGAFVVDYPRALQSKASRPTTVTFVPTVFAKDLYPQDVSVGPSGYSINPNDLRKAIDFTPQNVAIHTGPKSFQLGQLENVAGEPSLVWTWLTRAPERFKGTSFAIFMTASRSPLEGCLLYTSPSPRD